MKIIMILVEIKFEIGDTVGYNISRGLNSSTTYDNQGMIYI